MTDRELLQQVFRFLQQVIAYSNEEMARLDALKKLVRDRLAQPEPEPVAWAEIGMDYVALSAKPFENAIPLYTAPVHAIDMSQERVDETAKDRPDCNTCENRGVLIPLAQETYCENCIYGSPWKANYYKEKNHEH
jgi:hypothetical protein